MEYPTKKSFIWKAVGAAVILLAAGTGYFLYSSNGEIAFQNSAASIVQSWNNMVGSGNTQLLPSDINGNDDENQMDASSSENSTDDAPQAALPSKKIPKSKKTSSDIPEKGTTSSADDAPTANTAENITSEIISSPESTASSRNKNNTTAIAAPECTFPAAVGPSRKIILNEIAWMGSPSSSVLTAANARSGEWIELKNISDADIDLSGWQLADISGKIKIAFGNGDHISAGGFLLLARGASTSTPGAFPSQKIYSGDLVNTGDVLAIMDPECGVSDFVDASQGWPAGNNATKQTLERDSDTIGWHTSILPGGTPGQENSFPSAAPTSTSFAPTVTSQPDAVQQYSITVALQGDGTGTIVSDPLGMTCTGANCTGIYSAETQISLEANAGGNSVFIGWSGACSGQGMCSLTLTGDSSIIATFADVSESPATTTPTSSPEGTGTISHLLIAQVQIEGASSTNDFVKLYNPTSATIDASGWKLHKKSNTGTDYSLRTFPSGSLVGAGQYFTWANSEGGFSEAIDADVSSTETLASDNSVALLDASGTVIDAVAWGTGTSQYVEGSAYPTNPTANQMLTRMLEGGVIVDTDNNASDFTMNNQSS